MEARRLEAGNILGRLPHLARFFRTAPTGKGGKGTVMTRRRAARRPPLLAHPCHSSGAPSGGRCGSAHGSASATTRATPRPPPSRPCRSPKVLTPNIPAAHDASDPRAQRIAAAAAAKALDDLRRARLDPPIGRYRPSTRRRPLARRGARRDLRGVAATTWMIDGAAVRVSLVCFGENRSLSSPHPDEPRSGVSKDKGGPAQTPTSRAPSSFETAASPPPQDEGAIGSVQGARLSVVVRNRRNKSPPRPSARERQARAGPRAIPPGRSAGRRRRLRARARPR